MPPPLRSPSLLPSASCLRLIYQPTKSTRCFSTTQRHDQRVTRARRRMYVWLATKGAVFREPLAGSTNYLGAYNKDGELRRVVEAAGQKANERKAGADKSQQDPKYKEDAEKTPKDEVPPETSRDLLPFPNNPAFRSQPVLSVELRTEIWTRIMKDGKSVRQVSAELGVEMRRVGAVVRLMEVEKEWLRIVSFNIPFCPFFNFMMIL